MKIQKLIFYFLLLAILVNSYSCNTNNKKKANTDFSDWNKLLSTAKGQSVTLMMWQEDPFIMRYMNDFVRKNIKEKYGINIRIVSGQGNQIVSTLMSELEADKDSSEIDMVWINGETFYQLRQIKALYGPFVHYLPNSKLLNMDNPFIAYDFQKPIEGYECPWGNVQMTIIYNNKQVTNLPQTIYDFERWTKAHPGRFTISDNFTGITLVKAWFISLVDNKEELKGEFNEALYKKYSTILWDILKRMKPYLWNNGNSFPSKTSFMHRLFANGEIYFTLSNNDNEVNNKRRDGVFPDYAKAYVPNTGTIQNSHYWGITAKSKNKEAAMVICNYLISPVAQYEKNKAEVWGDGTVLDMNKINAFWKTKFDSLELEREFSPKRSELNNKALFELHAEYMIQLEKDFKKYIVGG